MGDRGYGISPDVIEYVADEIGSVAESGVEIVRYIVNNIGADSIAPISHKSFYA